TLRIEYSSLGAGRKWKLRGGVPSDTGCWAAGSSRKPCDFLRENPSVSLDRSRLRHRAAISLRNSAGDAPSYQYRLAGRQQPWCRLPLRPISSAIALLERARAGQLQCQTGDAASGCRGLTTVHTIDPLRIGAPQHRCFATGLADGNYLKPKVFLGCAS